MTGRRLALLVATDRYQENDDLLGALAAPASDARKLAAVLRDQQIAAFDDVKRLYNQPHYLIEKAISKLCAERGPEDLILLYFTGHGIKDENNQLHLAATNTDSSDLRFTAVQAEQIRGALSQCRSGQKVVILDCCFAGAYPSGYEPKSDTGPVKAHERLAGRGTVVLTSSDAIEYSFEENKLTDIGPSPAGSKPASVFTRVLIEGLRSGKADVNNDGDITMDDLYQYVYARVTGELPYQHPQIKQDGQGRIRIAWNINWRLPEHIISTLSHPYPDAKLAALRELWQWHDRGNDLVRQRVLDAVREFAKDDSKRVSERASGLLAELTGPAEAWPAGAEAEEAGQVRPAARAPAGKKRTATRSPGVGGQRKRQETRPPSEPEAVERRRESLRPTESRVNKNAMESGQYQQQTRHEIGEQAQREIRASAETYGQPGSAAAAVWPASLLDEAERQPLVPPGPHHPWRGWLAGTGIGILAATLIIAVLLWG